MEFEESLRAVQRLVSQNELTAADSALKELLQVQPQHVEALFVKAVIKRLMNQPVVALQTLSFLHDINPQHSRAHQEVGHLRMINRELKPAIESYERAVELDPA
ncbi:MAG: hypothetical protein HOM16_12260 [Woeseia sp.]|nr:hypothetical protein [Woeseia sp.]